ncbi:TDP-N-acetylfucosamine:lipid II N-acetylfucosaminyltransferase [Thermotoga profunda]|uniref:TDP-N-acetylfucosamine:lipid II N-acetylfucosaminyltransferase n=1 Tax=Thermotoga profunda TaxID=1508420 RepID=UPI001E563D4B|nr:TDP-N-acetylfucosamine:lipid II N-acetylfucosaminyltransferase [Thermotoga profunda]
MKYVNSNKVESFRLLNPIEFKNLIDVLKKSDYIFIHGLFDIKIISLFNIFSRFARKASWVLWGGDLYNYWLNDKHGLKARFIEFLKRRLIKRLHSVICFLEEDYKFLKEKYKTNAVYKYAFYPNPVDFETIDQLMEDNHDNSVRKLLIGNSASETNNHFEAFKIIKELDIQDFQIICPLSYGDMEYAKKVERYGRELFGERFIALMDYLPPVEYAKILTSVDVAVFAHRRQQALGNILALLYAGKKVYVRSDISTWKFLGRLGIIVFDTIKLLSGEDRNLFEYDEKIGQKNRAIIKRELSEERCAQSWKSIFDEFQKNA